MGALISALGVDQSSIFLNRLMAHDRYRLVEMLYVREMHSRSLHAIDLIYGRGESDQEHAARMA